MLHVGHKHETNHCQQISALSMINSYACSYFCLYSIQSTHQEGSSRDVLILVNRVPATRQHAVARITMKDIFLVFRFPLPMLTI